MTCTDHLSCRLAGAREAEAYTEEASGPSGFHLAVYVPTATGREFLGNLRPASWYKAPKDRWEGTSDGRITASMGGNAVPLSSAAEGCLPQAVKELVSQALNAAFNFRMALHG